MTASSANHLNIVMLCRDRQCLLEQSVKSLLENTTVPFSITFVDDESAPITKCWLSQYCEGSINSQVIHNIKSAGTGAARNQGIHLARDTFGDRNLLYLSDSDVYFRVGWDIALIEAYRWFGGTFPVIGGWNHPYHQALPFPRTLVYPSPGACYELKSYYAVAGPSWILDWKAWDKYGELLEDGLGVRQGEDWEWCQRIRTDGKQVGALSPHVVLHTGVTDSFGEAAPGGEIYAKELPEGVIAK